MVVIEWSVIALIRQSPLGLTNEDSVASLKDVLLYPSTLLFV